MERIYRSASNALVETFDCVTIGVETLHHLFNGACERSVVVEERAVAAAALSALESRQSIALRLADLQEFEKDNVGLLAQADMFLANYREQRRNKVRPHPVTPQERPLPKRK